MDLQKFLGGRFLQKDDVPDPIVVTIAGCSEEALDDGPKCIVHFEELEKGLVANKTNLRFLKEAFKTTKSDELKGKKAVLFNDLNVTYQGNCGGLRFRALSEAERLRAEGSELF
jgi:hypothetical protein